MMHTRGVLDIRRLTLLALSLIVAGLILITTGLLRRRLYAHFSHILVTDRLVIVQARSANSALHDWRVLLHLHIIRLLLSLLHYA